MCRGVWRAKVPGGVLQVAEFVVRGGTGEKEDLADKGCYGQPLFCLHVNVVNTAFMLTVYHRSSFRGWSPLAQGKEGHQAWFSSHQLLMPMFSGVSGDASSRMIRVDSKVQPLSPPSAHTPARSRSVLHHLCHMNWCASRFR